MPPPSWWSMVEPARGLDPNMLITIQLLYQLSYAGTR